MQLPSLPGIWVLLPSSDHYTSHPLSSIADHYDWLHAPLCRCQLVGTNDETEVGVTWLLSSGNKSPHVSDHAGTTEHPFSGEGIRGHWEALTGHDIPSNHTKQCHWIRKGLWPCCSIGTSMPGLLLNSSGGGPQIHVAGGWKSWLGICLHPAEQGPVPCTPI